MFYAFKVNNALPPAKDELGFEKPRGKLYVFNTRDERRQFVDSTKHALIISKQELRWLTGKA